MAEEQWHIYSKVFDDVAVKHGCSLTAVPVFLDKKGLLY